MYGTQKPRKKQSPAPGLGISRRVFTRLRITVSISTTLRCTLRYHLVMSNSKNRGFVANAGAFLSNATAMPSANESRGDDRLDEALKLAYRRAATNALGFANVNARM